MLWANLARSLEGGIPCRDGLHAATRWTKTEPCALPFTENSRRNLRNETCWPLRLIRTFFFSRRYQKKPSLPSVRRAMTIKEGPHPPARKGGNRHGRTGNKDSGAGTAFHQESVGGWGKGGSYGLCAGAQPQHFKALARSLGRMFLHWRPLPSFLRLPFSVSPFPLRENQKEQIFPVVSVFPPP